MPTNYIEELRHAQQRTLRFGLVCPEIHYSDDRFLTTTNQTKFGDIVFNAVGALKTDEIVAQCISLHLRLKDTLESFFGAPVLFTIGHVYMPHDFIFKQTEDSLLDLLQNGIQGSQVQLHAWLTLPSMEILDITLPTSLAVINGWSEGHGSVIAAHADELSLGLRYHPMLLGDDFLRKIGALAQVPIIAI